MEGSNNYGHHHPVFHLLSQYRLICNPNRLSAACSRCGEKVSAPCFSCEEECGFYLHEVCAEAPSELNHPFHRDHPLVLLPYPPSRYTRYICDFCGETCEKFTYHCSSCKFNFHIKCALFTFNIAKELEHVPLEPPLISNEIDGEEVEDVLECYGCWEALVNDTYFSLHCGFYLHKKCAELPLKLNHACHRKHPLLLQFGSEQLCCKICEETGGRGFIYYCPPCKFAIHIECVSPTPIIEDKSHPHPFSLLLRQTPFICDGCGTRGSHAAYTCCTCNIVVHKKCISLPRTIRSKWHDHRLFHTYFLHKEDFERLDCLICHDKVNTECGSYYCSKCKVIFHVNCALKDEDSYFVGEEEDEESLDISANSITNVLEWNDAGEATVIQHFKHIHPLVLSDRVSEYENKCCDGCLLPISASFYYCMQCGFFLHKVCAELPKVKHVWHHSCQKPLLLTSDKSIDCGECGYLTNSFAYTCEECGDHTCFRCVIALTPGARTCLGHKHPLLFYIDHSGKCDACGDDNMGGMFRCKKCKFSLDHKCFSLPVTAEDKCDEHILSLTYHDDSSYSETHFCDICEEIRDSKLWFYHCATCDTSAHVDCVLGQYRFLKLGSIVNQSRRFHKHPLTVVKKIYYYPDCSNCGEPCVDLSLQCTKPGCNFIRHAKCPS